MSKGAGSIIPPFPEDYRAAGILLHVTSLPSEYGIGDLGPTACAWIDQLSRSGQRWWQALPIGPTGYANSPYQALSSFAGNGLLISPALLIEEGLLRPEDCPGHQSPDALVDYGAVIAAKHALLEPLWARFQAIRRPELIDAFEQFCSEQAHWLDDYALFRALKAVQKGKHYLTWPAELVERRPAALAQARRDLAKWIDAIRLAQFLLFQQSTRLKAYANARGVRLIGDMPFFVSPDSSDVWTHPEFFLLDRDRRPRFVAGVPPDDFSAQGQLWGNPVYNWDQLRKTGYHWCIERFRSLFAHVDAIRLDHFRAFAAAWHIPANAASAQTGEWIQGPGADFFTALQRELGTLPFIAEDLGFITPDVVALREQFHLPGNRVLQFAFDGDPDNVHLPANIDHNCVVYTGTHDNPTTREWFETLDDGLRHNLLQTLPYAEDRHRNIACDLIRSAHESPAALAIIPLQDLFNLGAEARMNTPGRAEGNWRWRCTREMITGPTWDRLAQLTDASSRE